jgi:hypothetical protein
MSGLEKITYLIGSAILWILVVLGVFALVTLIPANSVSVQNTYAEFANEAAVIQCILSLPVLIGQAIILEIIYLLRLVQKDQMFTDAAFEWVKALALSAFALAVSIGVITTWLLSKNTLPPFVGMVLATSFLLALAVGLVVISLHGLLKRATQAAQELEGVI